MAWTGKPIRLDSLAQQRKGSVQAVVAGVVQQISLGRARLHAAHHGRKRIDRLGLRCELRIDGRNLDTVEQRQRSGGHVIRTLRWAARILADVRILLPLEHRLGEITIRLVKCNDVASGREAFASGGERRGSLLHLDACVVQRLHQPQRHRGIDLLGRDHIRVRPGRWMHGTLAHLVEIRQKLCTIDPHGGGHRFKRGHLVRNNIAQVPRAALPGIGVIPRGHLRVIPDTCSQLLERNLNGRRQVCTGRFGQDTQAVMQGDVVPQRRPEIVHPVHQHTGLARRFDRMSRPHAERIHRRHKQRIHVGIDRVHPRRQKQTRCVCTLLV